MTNRFKIIILFFILILSSSCVTFGGKEKATISPLSRVYYKVKKESVWKALLNALSDFEIVESSQERWFLITDWKEGIHEDYFIRYGKERIYRGSKYRISVFMHDEFGNGSESKKQGVNVKIIKEQFVENNNMGAWAAVTSDGYIEKSIHYRIALLLSIEKHFEYLERVKREKEETEEFDYEDDCFDDDEDGYCDDLEDSEDDCIDDDDDGYCDNEFVEEPKKKKLEKPKQSKPRKNAKKNKNVKNRKAKTKKSVFDSSFFTEFEN